jgi:Early Protein (E6)
MDWALTVSVANCQENMGHLEEALMAEGRELQRQLLEKAVQAKADNTPLRCPICGGPLTRVTHDHERTVESRFGDVRLRRSRGWCRKCSDYYFPADFLLGLGRSSASPGVQETAALLVSKMPAPEASAVLQRLTGQKMSPSTLEREAKRQGQKAQNKRKELDGRLDDWTTLKAVAKEAGAVLPQQPFVMIIELDAWNLRERDHWGQTEELKKAGQEFSRWHWAYGATCFRLDQRGQTAGGRPFITERGYVMTRGGLEELEKQLWAEAVRRGLLQANLVLVVADGAAWIWNLVGERFKGAKEVLDFYHAAEHLWAVANKVFGAGTSEAKQWAQPLITQLKEGKGAEVIQTLQEVLQKIVDRPEDHKTVEVERNYFLTHQARLDYKALSEAGYPIGSGAMESTCRQYQCRLKRTGQFWSTTGDEALIGLETLWRNQRWRLLFPHANSWEPQRN